MQLQHRLTISVQYVVSDYTRRTYDISVMLQEVSNQTLMTSLPFLRQRMQLFWTLAFCLRGDNEKHFTRRAGLSSYAEDKKYYLRVLLVFQRHNNRVCEEQRILISNNSAAL